MTDTLFSSAWYRVAELRPRLRGHAVIHRHVYRGQVWYVLQDSASGRFHRFSPSANLVIGLMDGRRTLREIWHTACTRLGDDAPTQDEVINVLASLHRADVLHTDASPDLVELHERAVVQRRMKLKQYLMNPLALRFPLVDPDRFLGWINPLTRHLFSWGGALLWCLVVGWALALGASHWDELTKDVTDRLLAADNLLLIGLVFPLAKIVHELGHGAAVKARGGEVHEMGVMLLVLMPVPYVDASASLAFRARRDRMLAGAAGMLSELLLAALAMFVWVSVEPGLVRAVAYNVMLVAGVSTLVFNANPLLRFDGYYILSDALEIPNLGQRANAYLGYLVRRYAFRVERAVAAEATPGERLWFVGYAVTSFVYRMAVMVTIAVLVAQRYFVVGVVLALWSLYSMSLQPLLKKLAYLSHSNELQGHRRRALVVTGLLGAALAAVVFWWPAPSWTRTEGVAVVPENAHVRALTDGFIQQVVAVPGRAVKRGEVLIVTNNPELSARVRGFEAQLREQQARYVAAVDDRMQRDLIRVEIEHIGARLDNARRRLADLVVRSPLDGRFVMPEAADAPGRFVRRGDVLGYAVAQGRLAVHVVVNQSDVDLVRTMTRKVELRTVERVAEVLPAVVNRVVPAATTQLPNLALSAQGGGEVTLDPGSASDPARGPNAASPLFIFELDLASPPAHPLSLGSRIYARFERHPEPLATQWWRALRGMLLNRFDV